MEITDQHVLVTGGAGFVGSHLSEALLDRGAAVAVVDDLFAGRRELVPEGAELYETDIRSGEFRSVVEEFDPTVLVHLAALHYVPYCNENPGEAFDVNVVGTRNVLEAARAADGLKTVVNASTAGVYPSRDGALPETTAPDPSDIYGKTKLIGEDLARLFQTDTGTAVVTARIFNVYGPNETNPHLIPTIIEQLGDGSRQVKLGNLSPARDFVHVRDVARALVALATFEGSYRVYNVGTGVAHSVREVVKRVGDALGDEVEVVQDAERVRETDRPHLEADITRIREEVGWEPTVGFVDGLRELLATEGVTA